VKLRDGERETYHSVTLLVNCTGSFAEIDFGSALAIVSVYMSENLGNLEETTKPVLVKDPCRRKEANLSWNVITKIIIFLGFC